MKWYPALLFSNPSPQAARVVLTEAPRSPPSLGRIPEEIGTDALFVCAECAQEAPPAAQGWRLYRLDEPVEYDPPALAAFCPECAEREFDD